MPHELPVQSFVIRNRIPTIYGRKIDHVQKHLGSLHMLQKFKSQAPTLMSSLNDSWNIGDHFVGTVIKFYHTQDRTFSRKRVRGGLGFRVRHTTDQRGFSGVGVPQKADVRDELELQKDLFGLSRLSESRCMVLVVAFAAGAALAYDDAGAELVQIF